MANLVNAIRTGIYSKLITNATSNFKTAVRLTLSTGVYGYKLFFNKAPQVYPGTSVNITPSYVVYDLLPIDNTRDTVNKFYNFQIQFRVCALMQNDCETLAGYLSDAFTDSESSTIFTGYKTIRITERPLLVLGEIDNVYNLALTYEIELQVN